VIRGVVYCIHLVGVGHMKRMLMLCEGLLEFAHITFIQGGMEVGLTLDHPNFQHIKLPFVPELLNVNFDKDKEAKMEVLRCMKIRKKVLFHHFNKMEKHDFVITEQIPFSKLMWLNETLSITKAIKELNPKANIICSHKGVTREDREFLSPDYVRRFTNGDVIIAKILLVYYDQILVHTDPKLVPLDENFYFMDSIKEKVHYTGFISKLTERLPPVEHQNKEILVTIGAGIKYGLFMEVLLKAIPYIDDYTFTVVKGPMMTKAQKTKLDKAAKKIKNLKVVEFLDNLNDKLRQCSLAITMAGFTLINLYATRTPALVIPDLQEGSQTNLARKFNDNNFIRSIKVDDLTVKKLIRHIKEVTENPPEPSFEIDINGIENSKKIIKQLLRDSYA